jgi:hypothetical protein
MDPNARKTIRRALRSPEVQTIVIAQAIRDALEAFHGGGMGEDGTRHGFLSDEHMKRLNICIRQTVHETLVELEAARAGDDKALAVVNFQCMTFPDYAEPPGSDALAAAFQEFVAGYQGEPP